MMPISARFFLLIIVLTPIFSLPRLTSAAESTPYTKDDLNKIYWQNFSPDKVKGIYITASTALNEKKIRPLVDLARKTEINAMVIDVKDGTDVYLNSQMGDLVQELLAKKIYPIARQVIFLDNKFGGRYPEYAIKNSQGGLWRDRLGNLWLDPTIKDIWDYNALVAKAASALGFKEIQFDYMRFPSDGALGAMTFPSWKEEEPKNQVIKNFVEYTTKEIKNFLPVKISADIFGYTFIAKGDLGIGQIVPDLIDSFDYLSPMVYPSHYKTGNFGYKNPAEHPYEVISETLVKGGKNFRPEEKKKIRAWIQGFDLGAAYSPEMIAREKQALYDFGLVGWLVWNPGNIYNEKVFE